MKNLTRILLSLVALAAWAGMDLAPDLQSAILVKLLKFDASIPELAAEACYVLAPDGESAALVEALNAAGIKGQAHAAATPLPASAKLVYVHPDVALPASLPAGALLIGGSAAQVESGSVAVAVGSENGKPKIVIHRGKLEASGHEISTKVLALARIVG